MPCVKIEKLTYVYSPGTPLETLALRDIDLEIIDGEFLVIAGSSGSGKSTLIQHLNGLLLPTRGRVKVLGRDIAEQKHRRELWRQVGVVFQYPERQVFSATVFDDIAFGPRNMGLDEKTVSQRVCASLDMVGLSVKIQHTAPYTLSSGMLRRVAIAGVLALQPKILVLDETGAGLNPETKNMVFLKLKELQTIYGVTVILITHDMEDAALYADRIVVLRQGELLYHGSVEQVLSQVNILREAGLELPYVVKLFARLKERGIDLPETPITVRDAVQVLVNLLHPDRDGWVKK